VNGKVYTFKTTMTATEGEVRIGADSNASLLNLARAINGTGGTPGTDYVVAAAHPTVSSSATVTANTITLTARTKGVAGNLLTLTETAVTLTVTGAVFAGGIDGTVAKRGQAQEDGTYLYFPVADNTVADNNWRRVALGAVY
jgi:phage tail sheath gpL-like